MMGHPCYAVCMNMFSAFRTRRLVLIAACVLFVCKAAFILLTPVRALAMSPWLLDDSFIVMRIARNIALGYGFSFDMTHPTTGVSMLWTYLTSLNHLLFSKDAAVHATLIASTLFGSLCTLLLFSLAQRITGKTSVAWLAFVLVSLMPVPFFNALNGMETSFFSLLILLGIVGAARTFSFSRTPLWQGAWTGLFAGLALMTRADAIFLVAAVLLLHVWDWIRRRADRRKIMQEATGFLVAVGICFGIFLLWQLMQTGSVFPDNQIGRRAIALADHHFSYDNFSLPHYLRIVIWNDFQLEALWSLAIGSTLLGLLALLWHMTDPLWKPVMRVTLLYLLLFCTALVLYQWYFPDFHGLRYLNPGIHIVLLAIAGLLMLWPLTRWRTPLLTIFVAIMLMLSWYRYFDYARRPQWATGMTLFGNRDVEAQNTFFATIDLINEQLPADAVIAVRDHGRIAYFTDRSIQDFAGIIDPEVLIAYKENRLAAYFAERNVSYVYLPTRVPGEESIYEALYESLQLEQVPNAAPEGVYGFRLYRILR